MGHLCTSCYASIRYYKVCITSTEGWDRHGRDRMVVGLGPNNNQLRQTFGKKTYFKKK
jgi:hypothetical protein